MAEAVPFRPYMLSGNGTVHPVQEVPSGCSAAAGFVRETARRSLVGNMGKQPNREEAPVHEPRACIPSITSTKDVSIIVIALTGLSTSSSFAVSFRDLVSFKVELSSRPYSSLSPSPWFRVGRPISSGADGRRDLCGVY